MDRSRVLPRLHAGLFIAALLAAMPFVASCKDSSGSSKAKSDGTTKPEKADAAVAVKASHMPVIDGESFTVRQIIDREQGNIPLCVFIAPEKWRDTSQVTWNYANNSSPVKVSASAENPANQEAFFAFPTAEFFTLRPAAFGVFRPGQNVGGLVFAEPMPPAQTLLAYIQQLRSGAAKLKVIGSKDLPDLPKNLQIPPAPSQHGVGVKITYELKGTPIEEEFYAVAYSLEIPYDGPQGRTWQINWGLNAVHSFRSATGTLDRRRPVFAAISKSFRPNPKWQQRHAAVMAYLQEQFNRQLQAGYDSIAAAGRLSRQISANNDAMLAAIDHQLQSSRSSSSVGTTAGRSSVEKFDDYIRGVDTVDDPYYGTSQHSSTEKYHWTDGYGTYRNSNDSTYNPNEMEKGNWTLMPMTR